MTTEAENILKAVYAAYDKNENYTISTPPSGSIHAYNMALKEIAPYIEFLKKNFCFAKAKPAVCPDCFFPVHKKNFCFAKAKPTVCPDCFFPVHKKNFCFAKAKPAVCPDCFFPVHKKNFCFAKAKPTARLLFSGSQGGI